MTLQERIRPADHGFSLRRVAGRIGAEISSLRVADGLSQAQVDALRAALLAHKVLFFRDQHGLTLAEQEAFSKCFGPIVAHPTIGALDGTEVALAINYEDGATAANEWHADETFMEAPPLAGILHAQIIPSIGGDTLWANTATAYDCLPEPLRVLADTLWAVHTNMSSYNAARRHPNKVTTMFETEQPLVRVHPETGERVLLLGFHAQYLIGLNRRDSARLIDLYQDHITRPENVVRWQWQIGDLVIWDNRATQHYGIGDFSEKRALNRVSVAGDAPQAVDGRRAVVRRQEQWVRS